MLRAGRGPGSRTLTEQSRTQALERELKRSMRKERTGQRASGFVNSKPTQARGRCGPPLQRQGEELPSLVPAPRLCPSQMCWAHLLPTVHSKPQQKQHGRASLWPWQTHSGRKNMLVLPSSSSRWPGDGARTPGRPSRESWEELMKGQKEPGPTLAHSHQPSPAGAVTAPDSSLHPAQP